MINTKLQPEEVPEEVEPAVQEEVPEVEVEVPEVEEVPEVQEIQEVQDSSHACHKEISDSRTFLERENVEFSCEALEIKGCERRFEKCGLCDLSLDQNILNLNV